MQLVLDTETLEKEGLSLEEALLLLLAYHEGFTLNTTKKLQNKNYMVLLGNRIPLEINNYKLTLNGKEFIEKLIKKTVVSKSGNLNRFTSLAEKMMALFPEGKMPHTNYAWRCSKGVVALKLQSFIRKFGEYEDDVILEATKRYVSDYSKRNYEFMQLLKYFIWKDGDKNGMDSQLLSYIENPDLGSEDNDFGNARLI